MKKLLRITCTAMFLSAASLFADPVLTLSFEPGPGMPGAIRGWGFSIINDSASYLVIEQAQVAGLGSVGTFDEFAATNFVVVNPLSTLVQSFNNDGSSGMGRFTILGTASLGSFTGSMDVNYSLYVNDPNNPLFTTDPGDANGLVFSGVAAPVVVGSPSAVPEPGGQALVGIGAIIALAVVGRLRAKAA